MNRLDHSIEITVVKDNVERKINLPFICDDQLWFQMLKTVINYKVEIPTLHLIIDRPIVEPAPK